MFPEVSMPERKTIAKTKGAAARSEAAHKAARTRARNKSGG
jgi:hypothetical protein